jgi:mono/diheme cytochrome c family protein
MQFDGASGMALPLSRFPRERRLRSDMRERVCLAIGLACASVMVVSLAALPTLPDQAAPTRPQDREDYNSGAYLFKTFCASCHGEAGRGDGPVADLSTPRASDLTTLKQRAGGTFPRARVMATLDGTARVNGHEAMPNWMNVLRRTERGDEKAVRQRLEALVDHVDGLQK